MWSSSCATAVCTVAALVIDIHLLASALVGRLRVWTADPRFLDVARELGVDYDGTGS